MSVTQSAEKPDGQAEVPKKRRSRRASNYIVLRKIPAIPPNNTADPLPEHYDVVARNGTTNGCVEQIVKHQIAGDLLIVCVRKRFTTSLQQELKFKNA